MQVRFILISTFFLILPLGPQLTAQTTPFDFAEIDTILKKEVEDGDAIGHSALVFHQGKVVYYQQEGQRKASKELSIERDTIFRIYSMSKPITSVAVMQLVEQGKIDLDAPISKYMPVLGKLKVLTDGETVPARREITARDLLRHTSGLTYGFFGNTKVDQTYRNKGVLLTDENLEGMVKKLGEIPLLHQPGKRFHYSVSTDVLGRLVEVVSEKRFGDYLKSSIFDPLEMGDTFFTVPKEKRPRFAEIYEQRGGKLKPKSPLASIRFVNENEFDSGGGGLCSTIDDYLKFCQALLNRGERNGKRILKSETLKQMFTNQLESIDQHSDSFKFGLGFRCFPEGDFGWGGAAGTRFWVHPEKQTAILYMVQINPYGRRNVGNRIRRVVYQAVKK